MSAMAGDDEDAGEVDGVMRRNIAALIEVRKRREKAKSRQETIADARTA